MKVDKDGSIAGSLEQALTPTAGAGPKVCKPDQYAAPAGFADAIEPLGAQVPKENDYGCDHHYGNQSRKQRALRFGVDQWPIAA
jgi:hypothetical protein